MLFTCSAPHDLRLLPCYLILFPLRQAHRKTPSEICVCLSAPVDPGGAPSLPHLLHPQASKYYDMGDCHAAGSFCCCDGAAMRYAVPTAEGTGPCKASPDLDAASMSCYCQRGPSSSSMPCCVHADCSYFWAASWSSSSASTLSTLSSGCAPFAAQAPSNLPSAWGSLACLKGSSSLQLTCSKRFGALHVRQTNLRLQRLRPHSSCLHRAPASAARRHASYVCAIAV